MSNRQELESTILIFAATAIDSSMSVDILADAGLPAKICTSLSELASFIERGAGAVLLAEEVIFPGGLELLKDALQGQPQWSDLPVIVLTRSGEMTEAGLAILQAMEELRSVTLLERPVRLMTLLSVLRAALKTRKRQYDMRDLLAEYKRTSELAGTANKAKSSFLANMSHEIRTPLNAIMGFGDLLLDANTNEEDRADFVATILRNGKLLTQIIDDILDLSKVEDDRLTLERVRLALPELIGELVYLVQPQVYERGLDLRVRADASAPHSLISDPTRLKQILLNIIGNAVKFTQQGQISIEIMTRHSSADAAPMLVFLVKDTGRGISSEQQLKLFQPFMQADVSTTRKFGGTGLGLILARRLAEALGGGLELTSSELEVGSTFTITVEAVEAEGSFHDDGKSQRRGHTPVIKEQVLQGLKILVVEDVVDNQKLIRLILRRSGALVDNAENGQEGIEKALQDSYDIILMDLQMPVKDGFVATAQLRQLGYDKPIIAVSAAAMVEERERALQGGCNDHITKPLSVGVLLKAICQHTGRNDGKTSR